VVKALFHAFPHIGLRDNQFRHVSSKFTNVHIFNPEVQQKKKKKKKKPLNRWFQWKAYISNNSWRKSSLATVACYEKRILQKKKNIPAVSTTFFKIKLSSKDDFENHIAAKKHKKEYIYIYRSIRQNPQNHFVDFFKNFII
jgi:hypothetical protein